MTLEIDNATFLCKDWYFIVDFGSIQDRIRMCKTNHVGLPQVLDHAVHPVIDPDMGHLPNTQRYLGHTSEPSHSDPLKVVVG